MSLQGHKDEDDSNKSSLEKRQANGFGQKGVAGRPKRDATELFNKHIESGRMEQLVDKVFDAWERGLDSTNDRLAVSTAEKFTKAFHNPDKRVIVEGGPSAEQIHMNIMVNQDNINPKDLALLQKFSSFLSKADEMETIEGEVVDEEPDGGS